LRRTLRVVAVCIAVHGAIFASGIGAQWQVLDRIYFFAILAPALILAAPFTPVLWQLHLMEAPGWFAWPRPLGFILAYLIWIIALYAASFIFRRRA